MTRPQHRHFLLARQAATSLPFPPPFWVEVTPHSELPGATSEPLTWMSSLGFQGLGAREERAETEMDMMGGCQDSRERDRKTGGQTRSDTGRGGPNRTAGEMGT